jgi:hypothetical protein
LHRFEALGVVDSISFEFIGLLLDVTIVMSSLVLEILYEFLDLNLLRLLSSFSFFEELSKLVSLDKSISFILLGVFD